MVSTDLFYILTYQITTHSKNTYMARISHKIYCTHYSSLFPKATNNSYLILYSYPNSVTLLYITLMSHSTTLFYSFLEITLKSILCIMNLCHLITSTISNLALTPNPIYLIYPRVLILLDHLRKSIKHLISLIVNINSKGYKDLTSFENNYQFYNY